MNPVAVIDIETPGLSPAMGDRAAEVAIVLLEGTKVVARFQSLMNARVRISRIIEDYTGISNEMIRAAPPAAEVMAAAARFVQDVPLVAHNASFDQRFWAAELGQLSGVRAWRIIRLPAPCCFPAGCIRRLAAIVSGPWRPSTPRLPQVGPTAPWRMQRWLLRCFPGSGPTSGGISKWRDGRP
jgi:hypothetical protein